MAIKGNPFAAPRKAAPRMSAREAERVYLGGVKSPADEREEPVASDPVAVPASDRSPARPVVAVMPWQVESLPPPAEAEFGSAPDNRQQTGNEATAGEQVIAGQATNRQQTDNQQTTQIVPDSLRALVNPSSLRACMRQETVL